MYAIRSYYAFSVTLSNEIEEPVSFSYAASDISTESTADFTLTSGSITFDGGSATGAQKTIVVTIENDDIAEATETYNINLSSLNSSGQSNVIISDGIGLGTILDNDIVYLTVHGFEITETEASQTGNFYVSRDIASEAPITLYFSTSDGTAFASGDYSAQSAVVVTLPASSTADVNVSATTIAGDLIAEPTETFTGTISENNYNSQQVTLSVPTATSTIYDNDIVHITLVDKTVTEINGTQSVNYVLTTDIAAEKDIVLNFAVADDSALAGSDYTTPTYTSVTIPHGSTTINIPIDVLRITSYNVCYTKLLRK